MNLIKNSTKFNSLIRELTHKLLRRKLSEITTTASIDGYETPNAFKGISKKKKKLIKLFESYPEEKKDCKNFLRIDKVIDLV